jgi:hypothetical protein
MTTLLPPDSLVGQIVVTHDGQRIGRIEIAARDAFKVEAKDESFWARQEAVARITTRGLVILAATSAEPDQWAMASPADPITPDV